MARFGRHVTPSTKRNPVDDDGRRGGATGRISARFRREVSRFTKPVRVVSGIDISRTKTNSRISWRASEHEHAEHRHDQDEVILGRAPVKLLCGASTRPSTLSAATPGTAFGEKDREAVVHKRAAEQRSPFLRGRPTSAGWPAARTTYPPDQSPGSPCCTSPIAGQGRPGDESAKLGMSGIRSTKVIAPTQSHLSDAAA